MMRLSHRAFERLVADALDSLPEAILALLDNVAVVVADAATVAQERSVGLAPGMVLLGLYEGVPRTERTSGYGVVLPDKVTIFQRALEERCETEAELVDAVRHTLVHELAHHLGISDARLVELGYEPADDRGDEGW